MKKLELCNYGVQEMNAVEMKETDGGFWQYLVAGVMYFAWEVATNPQAHINAWNEGWAAGGNH